VTELLTVWAEIAHDFGEINDQDIRRAQWNLGKMLPEEKPLGALHSEALKKLWALAQRYEGAAKQAALDSAHKAETEEEKRDWQERAQRLASLEEVVRDLFWTQAKDDAGGWGRTSGAIGLRADWMLVLAPDRPPTFQAILGGLMRPPE
jgi:hypothetical protein